MDNYAKASSSLAELLCLLVICAMLIVMSTFGSNQASCTSFETCFTFQKATQPMQVPLPQFAQNIK